MEHFDIGDNINIKDFNAIVYLLRKFKRLTSDLKLGSNVLESDYGTYSFSGGLTSVGGNFIIESDVTVSSSDCLKNCFYSFHFTAIDVNLSGTVNHREVTVTGDTGNNGELEITLPTTLLGSDEVLLPDFKVDIVFDEHEYYTPISALNITLDIEELYIDIGETNTITATVIDDSGDPVSGLNLGFNINGNVESDITDSDGVASITYTGVSTGWVNVTVSGESIRFYVGEVTIAEVRTYANSVILGRNNKQWLISEGDVIIDWGDGTQSVVNNPTTEISHRYNDRENYNIRENHNITFIGNVTSLGELCFYHNKDLFSIDIANTVTSLGASCFSYCTNLTSITIPDSVTLLGVACFSGSGLTSINIPDSVTTIREACFIGCADLVTVTIPDSVTTMNGQCFQSCSSLTSIVIPSSITLLKYFSFKDCTALTSVTIPSSVTAIESGCFDGCTSLVDYQLYWTGNDIITYDSLKMPNNTNTVFTIPYGQTSNYTAKNYPSSKLVERSTPIHTYSLSIASDKQSILTTESVTLTGTLLMDSSPYTGQSVALYDGSTLIDTLTTDSNGEYSKTISGLTAGTHSFKAVNTNAESSTVSVTVTEPTPVHDYSLTVTGTAIIQTGDSDTITATLLDNNVPVSGETLSYQIKQGSTVIDSGTDTTDSNGQITISYTGTGIGDIDVIVSYGSLLQETYGVWDTIKYDNATSDSHTDSIWSSLTYLTRYDEYSTLTDSYIELMYTSITDNTCIEVDVNVNEANTARFISIRNDSTEVQGFSKNSLGISNNNWYHLLIKLNNGEYQVFVNGTDKTPSTHTISTFNRFYFRNSADNSVSFKNFKIYSA